MVLNPPRITLVKSTKHSFSIHFPIIFHTIFSYPRNSTQKFSFRQSHIKIADDYLHCCYFLRRPFFSHSFSASGFGAEEKRGRRIRRRKRRRSWGTSKSVFFFFISFDQAAFRLLKGRSLRQHQPGSILAGKRDLLGWLGLCKLS